jgi:hypothetical protein
VTSLIIVQLSKICVADFKIRVATFHFSNPRRGITNPHRVYSSSTAWGKGISILAPLPLQFNTSYFCPFLINYMHFATMQHPWDCLFLLLSEKTRAR